MSAASGDLPVLRNLACQAYDAFLAYTVDTESAEAALTWAVTFARLAASHGNERDQETLMFLLCQLAEGHRTQGRRDIGTCLEAEALNLANDLADDGREDMAEMVARAANVLSADTFAEAICQRAQGRADSADRRDLHPTLEGRT